MKDKISVYRNVKTINKLGREVYETVHRLDVNGVVDLLAGTVNERAMKISENSTHILLCRVVEIQIGDWIVCNNDLKRVYEVTYCDNVMNRNHHLEVELKYLPDTEVEL